MESVLNPALYKALYRLSGGSVKIAKEGEGLEATYFRASNGCTDHNLVTTGEYYRICCPYCHHQRGGSVDTRHRLYVNYRWGVPDPSPGANGNSFWRMAICFNEGCLQHAATWADFRSRVYSGFSAQQRAGLIVNRGMIVAPERGPAPWPGECLPLTELSASHPAIQYLHSRQFDPAEIFEKYGVRFCAWAERWCPVAVNRLIIPIMQNGAMKTWQARAVGESDWKYVCKYYNCPGQSKSNCLYGMDQAKDSPSVVVVEGVTDVWRMGDGAVALLGKSLSRVQLELLKSRWRLVVIMLDDDAKRKAAETCERLRAHVPCVRADLEPGRDPADYARWQAWKLAAGAIEQGILTGVFA